MFLGEYSHSLDAKGRLTMPSRLREALEDGMVVTRGYEKCITVYPRSEWEILCSRASELTTANEDARSYRRRLFGRAFEVSLDKLGRILIPSVLRDFASIDGSAVVVGLNTYLEIWAPELWQATIEAEDERLDQIQAAVSGLGI